MTDTVLPSTETVRTIHRHVDTLHRALVLLREDGCRESARHQALTAVRDAINALDRVEQALTTEDD